MHQEKIGAGVFDMLLIAQLSRGELTIGLLGIALIVGYGLWGLVRWLFQGPSTPDPWDEQVAAQLAAEETLPLCHRCLSPHDGQVDFCPECGAAVGQYTNWLPFPWLFSLGHTLRLGTSGEFKQSRLTIFGFLLLSLAEYMLLAPVYWFIFLRELSRRRATPPAAQAAPPSG